jgi:hypothetical protein
MFLIASLSIPVLGAAALANGSGRGAANHERLAKAKRLRLAKAERERLAQAKAERERLALAKAKRLRYAKAKRLRAMQAQEQRRARFARILAGQGRAAAYRPHRRLDTRRPGDRPNRPVQVARTTSRRAGR